MNTLKEKKARRTERATAAPESPQLLVKQKPRFIAFGQPDIGKAEMDAVMDVLRSGWLSTGPVVHDLEREFQLYMGSGHAVAVSSATMGLMLSLAVCGMGDGREMVTTPLTFPATVNAMLAMRVKPIFVDVDDHGQLDSNRLRPMLMQQNHIDGILPVHYGGAACDLREILHLAAHHNIKVVEDAAHAFGAEYVAPAEGNQPGLRRKIGTVGDYAVFSLYPTKNITAGEGGVVMARHADMAERIRTLSMQGLSSSAWDRYGEGPVRRYEVMFAGYKGNLSDVHAAIGLAQLRRWPELLAKRTKIWNIYEDAFGWREPGHSRSLFMIRVKDRDLFRQRMQEAGIGTGIHYSPLHLEPAYKFLGHKLGDFPVAEKIGLSTVSLPVSSTMTEEDAHRVVTEAKRWMM